MNKEFNYIEKYHQMIHESMEGINKHAIEESIDSVIEFVRLTDHDKSELIDFHDTTKLIGGESYKYDVFDNAHEALCLEQWDISSIGSGAICGFVVDAMKHTDNLVNRQFGVPQFLSLLKNAEKQNRQRYEEALYSVYFGADEEMAFKKAVDCFGGKYPLIAFLFFIKDRDRFLPTSPDSFDSIFESMGLGYKMSARCSWSNYCEFIAIITYAQEYLTKSGVCSHAVSLLDAHSAIWLMHYTEYKAWHNEEKDINTPMRPKKKIRKADGTISFQCGRCGYSFRQNDRCPECGQLVKV